MTPAALRHEVGDAAAAELEKPPQLYPVPKSRGRQAKFITRDTDLYRKRLIEQDSRVTSLLMQELELPVVQDLDNEGTQLLVRFAFGDDGMVCAPHSQCSVMRLFR